MAEADAARDREPAGENLWPETRVIAALFALALLVRVVTAFQIKVIFNDGPIFLEIAEQLWEGAFATAFAHQYHPLYPLLVAGARFLVGELELAGLVVSLLAGSLAVVALYYFLRRAFDRQTAWIGGVLMALHPYAAEFSADVQSEGLYIALFLAGVAGLFSALAVRSAPRALLAGALAGLAYLVRPEGLGLVGVGVLVVVARLATRRWSLAEGVRFGAALLLGAALLAGPYLVHLHAVTGHWTLTQKKSLEDFSTPAREPAPLPPGTPDRRRWRSPQAAQEPDRHGAELLPAALFRAVLAMPPAARIELEPRELDALFELVVVGSGSMHFSFVVFLVFGLFLARGRLGDRGVFLTALLLVYGVALYLLALNVGYLSRRHVLVPVLPLLGYAAMAVPVVGRALLSWCGFDSSARGARGAFVGLMLVAAMTLPKTWATHREERLATRRAAEWLAAEHELTGPVAAVKYRDAYYAESDYVGIARAGPKGELVMLKRAGARFLVVDDVALATLPGLLVGVEAGRARELYRVEAGGRVGYVYELVAAAP